MKDLFEEKAQGYKVENGKLIYFSNMLDGYRHEYTDLQEICEEMDGMLKKFDSLMAQIEFWQSEAKEAKKFNGKLVEDIIKTRKETAREIFDTIIKALKERKERVKAFYGVPESVGADVAIRTIKELSKKYGVEVE